MTDAHDTAATGMNAPQLGSYIRPVGKFYAYCYQVICIVADANGEQWQVKRFGLDDARRPVTDGHQHMHYLDGLQRVAPGVWKDEQDADTRWSCEPRYFRQMTAGPQKELFA